jgi:DNA-binding NtrC family response regulator
MRMTPGHDSILLVGLTGANQESMAYLLRQRDWNWSTADSLRSAIRELGRSGGVELVLASEALPDGRAYELSDVVSKRGASFLVGVMLSEGQIWLPVVERGERTFGRGGIGMAELSSVLRDLLDDRVSSNLQGGNSRMKAGGNEQIVGASHKVATAR